MNDEARRAQFETLYAEHAGRVFRFALRLAGNREDAEDLAAEVLAEAFRTLDKYRGESTHSSWLFAIVLNKWKMQRRKGKVPVDPIQAAEEVAGTFQFQDLALAQAIQSLPSNLREAFLLVKSEGFTHAEAAKIVRVPIGTMYFRVYAAIRQLRSDLMPCASPKLATIEVTCDKEV
jgi:RNA polymerase sigma-70 factor (ECF subfamily)